MIKAVDLVKRIASEPDVTLYKQMDRIKAAFYCIYNQYSGRNKNSFSVL